MLKRWKMKNYLIILMTILIICSGTFACTPQQGEPNLLLQSDAEQSAPAKLLTVDEYLESLPDHEKNWMSLTSGQYLKDFEILYLEMKENYRYLKPTHIYP